MTLVGPGRDATNRQVKKTHWHMSTHIWRGSVLFQILMFTEIGRTIYSILSDAHNAGMDGPCVSLFHDLCFRKP